MVGPQMSFEDDSPGYSIRVASRLTGLSADTLRMWERRYGFPSPKRNDSKIRVYSKDDVERLTLVSRAQKAGYRAGEVIHKSKEELRALLVDAITVDDPSQGHTPSVSSLVQTLHRNDADGLRTELRSAVATLGPKRFLVDVAGPLLERVGEEWALRRLDIRHEHLISEALTTQLRLLLSAYEGTTQPPVVLLSTLPEEQHGLGLEMVALYCAIAGATPRLLGVDTPVDQIIEAARALRVDAVGVSVSRGANLATATAHLGMILEALPPRVELWAGGTRAKDLQLPHPAFKRVVRWTDLDRELSRFAR